MGNTQDLVQDKSCLLTGNKLFGEKSVAVVVVIVVLVVGTLEGTESVGIILA